MKYIVITGTSHGIGKELAKLFLSEDNYVIGIDVLPQSIFLDNYWHIEKDLSKKKNLDQAIDLILDQNIKIDLLINNACLNLKGILSGCTYEEFQEVLNVGVVAPYYLVACFKDSFTDKASIINISSTRADQSQADTESYSATKGALNSLTHALAVSLKHKVRVNSISLGWINAHDDEISSTDSSQHLVNRVGKPKDVFNAIKFLASSENDFIDGANIVIDGGMSKQMIYHNDFGWTKND